MRNDSTRGHIAFGFANRGGEERPFGRLSKALVGVDAKHDANLMTLASQPHGIATCLQLFRERIGSCFRERESVRGIIGDSDA